MTNKKRYAVLSIALALLFSTPLCYGADDQPRKVLDQETLKKISDTLCTEGFKSYVGTEKKNVCQNKAASPDLAYSCVWDKKGRSSYVPNEKGPCSLDFAEHQGNVIITKENYVSYPPLPYGTEIQCCVRAAQAPVSSH